MSKKLPCYLLLCLTLPFIITGCKKSVQPLPSTHVDIPAFSQLKVDPDFDWKLAHAYDLQIHMKHQGMVLVSTESNGLIFHKGFYHDNANYHISFQIPDYIKSLNINGNSWEPGSTTNFSDDPGITRVIEVFDNRRYKSGNGLTPGDEFTFSSNDVKHIHAAKIDDQKFIITYFENQINGYYGEAKAVIAKITGNAITFGNPVTIMTSGKKSGNKSPYYTINSKVVVLSGDKAIIAFKGNWEWMMGGMALVADINGMNLNPGPMHSFLEYLGQTAEHLNIIRLNDQKFALAYGDGYFDEGSAVIGEVDGGDIYFGEPAPFSWSLPAAVTAEAISENSFVVGYASGNNGKTRIANVYGTNIDFQEAAGFTASGLSNLSSAISAGNTLIFTYRKNASGSGYSMPFILEGSGLIPGEETIFSSGPVQHNDVEFVSETEFALVFENENPETGNVLTGIINDNQLAFDQNTVFDQPVTDPLKFLFLNENFSSVIYADAESGPNQLKGKAMLLTYGQMVVDTDGDGIPDDEDDYPEDPLRAFDNFIPANGLASLAFEDQWPARGDYDFNDLVIDYQFQSVTNASNHVVEIFARFTVKAVGASFKNGFGFSLPEAEPSIAGHIQVSGYQINEGFINLNEAGLETGQQSPTVVVFDNSFSVLPSPGGMGVNTVPENTVVEPVMLELLIVPDMPFLEADFKLPHFNPFLIVNQERGREIHLPDYAPTDLCDQSYFGTLADASVPLEGIYYKTGDNLPWAVHIPEAFNHTIEKAQIHHGYLHFIEWAQSPPNNQLYIDWYKDLPGYRNDDLIY